MGAQQAAGAIVPATPQALLRLILALEEPEEAPVLISEDKHQEESSDRQETLEARQIFPWKAVALTSAVWLAALAVLGLSLTGQIHRQDQRLQELIERLDAR
jgi:ABC-type nitrate/sulfonate/bicarbonate transport system ATPase subunit